MPTFAEKVAGGLARLRARDASTGLGRSSPATRSAQALRQRLPGPLATVARRYVGRTIGHRFETFALGVPARPRGL